MSKNEAKTCHIWPFSRLPRPLYLLFAHDKTLMRFSRHPLAFEHSLAFPAFFIQFLCFEGLYPKALTWTCLKRPLYFLLSPTSVDVLLSPSFVDVLLSSSFVYVLYQTNKATNKISAAGFPQNISLSFFLKIFE